MSLESLADIGELLGGIAVIVSLLYLALQIRQNTASLRETTARQTLDANVRLTLTPVEHPEVAELLDRGSQGFETLNPSEITRLHLFLMAVFLHYQDTHSHAARSLIERHLWVAHETHMLEFLESPGVSAWWDRNRHRFSPEFVSFVDGHRPSGE